MSKTITLDIIKKNRVYFKCKTANGYPAKLVIDDLSKNLELKSQELAIEDISIRSQYGVDVIYRLIQENPLNEFTTLKTRFYNTWLIEECRSLGGKFDDTAKAWIFPKFVEDKVEELDYLYNFNMVVIELIANEDIYEEHGPVKFLGYIIARATSRDSGVELGDGIAHIKGKIGSSGSVRNWLSMIYENSHFRLKISRNLLDKYLTKMSDNVYQGKKYTCNILKYDI